MVVENSNSTRCKDEKIETHRQKVQKKEKKTKKGGKTNKTVKRAFKS